MLYKRSHDCHISPSNWVAKFKKLKGHTMLWSLPFPIVWLWSLWMWKRRYSVASSRPPHTVSNLPCESFPHWLARQKTHHVRIKFVIFQPLARCWVNFLACLKSSRRLASGEKWRILSAHGEFFVSRASEEMAREANCSPYAAGFTLSTRRKKNYVQFHVYALNCFMCILLTYFVYLKTCRRHLYIRWNHRDVRWSLCCC